MNTGTDFAKYLSKFLSEYLPFERNMSPNTIAAYRDTFVQFIGYMKDVQNIRVEQLTLDELTRQRVLDFLSWVQNGRNCGIATRNQRLAAIRALALSRRVVHRGGLRANLSAAAPEWRNGRRNGLKHRRAMPMRVRVPPPACGHAVVRSTLPVCG